MERPPFKAEWQPALAFAEVAEALGVDTRDVMACTAIEKGKGALVLYTGDTDDLDESVVYRALLERDGDGILRLVKHARLCTAREFMERADREIGAQLRDVLGEPDASV